MKTSYYVFPLEKERTLDGIIGREYRPKDGREMDMGVVREGEYKGKDGQG